MFYFKTRKRKKIENFFKKRNSIEKGNFRKKQMKIIKDFSDFTRQQLRKFFVEKKSILYPSKQMLCKKILNDNLCKQAKL